jgi:hypothetical protein
MSAVPGSENLGPYRRIYDKSSIQCIIAVRKIYFCRLTIWRTPRFCQGPVKGYLELKNARFDLLNFSRRVDFSQLRVKRISGVRKRP